jgi:exopolyphosphatase / guanosine-5'-triphosphate,3'-diphosphate pyrophosphatase
MNVGAVDIGTNSVRLLVTDGAGSQLAREMHITRLGQDVDRTGVLAEQAIARTVAVLETYATIMRDLNVQRMRATATSAARDAQNRDVFFTAAARALGSAPECIPGEEEALLSFRGATAGLDLSQGPFLVVDIGGGSTEFVLGSRAPEALISVDMGCVRMTERHLHRDPPRPAELDALFEDVGEQLRKVRSVMEPSRAQRMIGLAGTITALALLRTGSQRYDPALTHHSTLTRPEVEALFEQLASADVAARRAMLAEPKRAEVIVGGAAVLLGILREFAIDALLVSESDILDGLAASIRPA